MYDFEFPSLDAMSVKLPCLPALFTVIKRFDRIAVVIEKTWLKYVNKFEGALFLGLKIKAFDLDEKDEAEV